MKKKILLIGGGGHCRSVLDALRLCGEYTDIGIVDKAPFTGEMPPGVRLAGCDDDLPRLYAEGWREAFITLGSVGNTAVRRRIWQTLKTIGFSLPVIADPSAAIAADAKLGEGVFVGKRAVVNAGAVVGACAIINSGAIAEHDVTVGAFAHLSPGAVVCGVAKIGDDVHIGAGSVVIQCVTVGEGTLIGAGSTVVKDIPAHVKAFGTPCTVRN